MPDKQVDDRTASKASIKSAHAARFRERLLASGYIQDDRRQEDRGDAARRNHKRAEIDAKAKLRAPSKLSADARVQNLSAGGCCLQLLCGSFKIGETVWFKMDGVENWMGTVRWIDGSLVGVEFAQPFYPAVFEHIVSLNKPVELDQAA